MKHWIALCDADKLPADSGIPGLLSYEAWMGAQTDNYDWPEFDENCGIEHVLHQRHHRQSQGARCTATARRCCTPRPARCPMR